MTEGGTVCNNSPFPNLYQYDLFSQECQRRQCDTITVLLCCCTSLLLYSPLSSLPCIGAITIPVKRELYLRCAFFVRAFMLTLHGHWADATWCSIWPVLQTTPLAVKTMRLENGGAHILPNSRRCMGGILVGFGDRHLRTESIDTAHGWPRPTQRQVVYQGPDPSSR